MARINQGKIIADEIYNFKMKFILATEDQRLKIIESYQSLGTHQRVALMQAKKFMTPKEKRAYRQQIDEMQSGQPESC